jgi:two-component system response regulator AtoC
VRDHTVDIRVITATNRSLPQMVAEGRFRSDLMYRLNTLTVEVPPLRERGTDIVLLAGHFLTELASRYGKPELRLGTAAARRLQSHDWPGNVRELRNVMEQAVLHCTGRELPPDLLGIPASGSRPDAAAETTGTPVDPPAPDASLADIERNTIEKALLQTGGNISAASRRLGISRDQLRYRIAKYGLDPRA